MKEELLKGLSEEQIAKLKECKNQEEMLAVAKEEGVELSDDQLEAVSGGGCNTPTACKVCGSTNIRVYYTDNNSDSGKRVYITCNDCHYEWHE